MPPMINPMTMMMMTIHVLAQKTANNLWRTAMNLIMTKTINNQSRKIPKQKTVRTRLAIIRKKGRKYLKTVEVRNATQL